MKRAVAVVVSRSMSNNLISYFKLLEIPESYEVIQNEVQKNYFLALQRYHPDKHALADLLTKQQMIEKSSQINTAYKTIQDPYLRGVHLLSLQGVSIEELDGMQDIDFLEMIMPLQQAVELAENLELIEKKIYLLNEELIKLVGDSFNEDDYVKTKSLLQKLLYAQRLKKNYQSRLYLLKNSQN